MNNTAEKVAKILLGIKAVSLNPKKPFRYTSGMLSPIYTDCRILMSYPKERRIVRDLLIDNITKAGNFDVIAGTATAGIPHAAWIADKMNLPMIYVRGQPKGHGKENQIEGLLKQGQKAAVIEDLISTGKSSIETAKAIRDKGGSALVVFSIMTYSLKKAKDSFKENNIKHIFLTDFQTIVHVAEKCSYLNKKGQQTALEWAKDPTSWGKKMGFEV